MIIACPSGVAYTSQVGDHACLHPELKGVFVPLQASSFEKLDYVLQREQSRQHPFRFFQFLQRPQRDCEPE